MRTREKDKDARGTCKVQGIQTNNRANRSQLKRTSESEGNSKLTNPPTVTRREVTYLRSTVLWPTFSFNTRNQWSEGRRLTCGSCAQQATTHTSKKSPTADTPISYNTMNLAYVPRLAHAV